MTISFIFHCNICSSPYIPNTRKYLQERRSSDISDISIDRPLPFPAVGSNEEKDFYMIQACNSLTPNQNIVPEWARQDDMYASAKTAPLGSHRLRFGMDEVCGCTILFVKSQKRVYIGKSHGHHDTESMLKYPCAAHYWENRLFGLNKGERRRKLDFDTQVLGFIANGYQPPNGPRECSKCHSLILD